MRLPRMTVRSWMVVVATVAFGLTAIPVALQAIASALLDDVYETAHARVEETWSVRAAPRVIVDTFDGGILVHPGEPGVVKVTVEPHCIYKNGLLAQARSALKQVDVRFAEEGGTIRVSAKQLASLPRGCNLSASAALYVPPGASLVLRASEGPITVSGELSELVVEDQGGAVEADIKIGAMGAPKLDRSSGTGLEVVGGSLLVGGRDRGTVSPGDHVELRGEGKLFVNGAER